MRNDLTQWQEAQESQYARGKPENAQAWKADNRYAQWGGERIETSTNVALEARGAELVLNQLSMLKMDEASSLPSFSVCLM